ncbi:paraquat-inducible protein A [Paracoccus sp. p4-l81]|uniref:paraquat-inducible protein A n=1 Tax=unclassified Paracoccus (in: a-proteobacteria) TaxID=2688777 RepID=UPI0035B80C04
MSLAPPPPQTTDLPPTESLLACPFCDALHLAEDAEVGQRLRCHRCGTLLMSPRDRAFPQIIALSFTAMVLMIGAVFFPFLRVHALGIGNETSIFGAALAFSDGWLAPLSLAVLVMIVALPVARMMAIVYVLWPLANGRAPFPHAATAFRLSEETRPWAMAEIFIIGTAIALVKVAGLATIDLGPAFWALCMLILVVALTNSFMCRWTIWRAIETGGRDA